MPVRTPPEGQEVTASWGSKKLPAKVIDGVWYHKTDHGWTIASNTPSDWSYD